MSIYLDALLLNYGTIGLYGLLLRSFILFGLITTPILLFIDAPFGRFVPRRFSINGNFSWLLMELVSPLSFTLSLLLPLSSSPPLPSPTFSLSRLPLPRQILAALFLIHYLNRSLISTLRNPGRAKMHLAVPFMAAFFNTCNGFIMGTYVGGGYHDPSLHPPSSSSSNPITPLFLLGCTLWLTGFTLNIYSDEILYSLKRSPTSPTSRYSIPHGFLYSYPLGGISHPSYFVEWIEWSGFILATFAIEPSLFPDSLARTTTSTKLREMISHVPNGLWPLQGWYVQPPALFLINEIACMLPRAISGHRWYQKTFGDEFPKERKIVIPGIF